MCRPCMGFPGGAMVKNLLGNARGTGDTISGEAGWISGLGRLLG